MSPKFDDKAHNDDDDDDYKSTVMADMDKETKENEEEEMTKSAAPPSTSWLYQDQARSSKEEEHQQYQFSSRHTKEWIDQWTASGLSNYVSLPMICVLGDTSSGKSSVLSSLIGLELPSASTLTTKCPVLVQLKQTTTTSELPKATVHVQWHRPARVRKRTIETQRQESMTRIEKQVEEMKAAYHNNSQDDLSSVNTTISNSTMEAPPPMWSSRVLLENLEQTLPKVIQEAQSFILQYRETLVAPDTICVTLESPDCQEELTLVDLPGLVQFQHNQDSSLLSQVEQVVMEYVQNPRSILLPIVAAPSNIHNSIVLQWALEFDPKTTRTIPVLTKPDLIDPGSEPDVLKLLQSSQFRHGFYMVKNRGQALLDKGATIQEGLEEEMEYFRYTLPWNALTAPILGVANLRTKLAQVLWQVMQDSLPEIILEVRQQLMSVQSKMDAMGAMYTTRQEQRKFYHSLSQTLVAQIRTELSGKGPRNNNINYYTTFNNNNNHLSSPSTTTADKPRGAAQLHAACNEFYKEIQSGSLATIRSVVDGASVLISVGGSSGSGEDIRGELVHIDQNEGFACCDYIDAKDHSTDVLFDGIGYTADQPDFEADEVWSDGTSVFIGRAGGIFDSMRKLPLHRIRTNPSWLSEKIQQFRTDDLACFVNVDMFQHIVAEFVQEDWAPPCQKMLATLEDLLNDTLNAAIKDNMEQSRFPLLKNMVETTCHKVARRLLEQASEQVREHLKVEEQHPYTQDEVLLNAMNEVRYENLRKDLEIQLRLDQEGVVFDTMALKSLLDRVFQKHQRQNWVAEQMELVLSCYGKVATQRVLDRTPQICWQAVRTLPKLLLEELGGVTDDILETCLWESPNSRKQYEQLQSQLEDLQRAMKVVTSIR
eukprot:scaffold2744_cov136-Cylindrotheca_fusiformis.AAC.20